MEALFYQVEGQARWIGGSALLLLIIWETQAPFFAFFTGRAKVRGLHFLRNFLLTALNAVMISAFFITAWLWAAEWSATHRVGLLYLVDLPPWLHALGAIILFDCWTYWWHRMNHKIPWLWRFHRVHHSDAQMDVSTSNRFHFGEIFISSTIRIALIPLFGAHLWHLALYEGLMFPIVQFHHANVGLPERWDRWLRILFVTPDMHKVHHSRWRTETDSNYTSFLSLWDRLFGSFRRSANPRDIALGLEEFDSPEYQTIVGLLKTPFACIIQEESSREVK